MVFLSHLLSIDVSDLSLSFLLSVVLLSLKVHHLLVVHHHIWRQHNRLPHVHASVTVVQQEGIALEHVVALLELVLRLSHLVLLRRQNGEASWDLLVELRVVADHHLGLRVLHVRVGQSGFEVGQGCLLLDYFAELLALVLRGNDDLNGRVGLGVPVLKLFLFLLVGH